MDYVYKSQKLCWWLDAGSISRQHRELLAMAIKNILENMFVHHKDNSATFLLLRNISSSPWAIASILQMQPIFYTDNSERIVAFTKQSLKVICGIFVNILPQRDENRKEDNKWRNF